MTHMDIIIPDELKAFMDRAVEAGAFAGPGELIVSALYEQRDRLELEHLKLERLRRDLDEGLGQIERGEAAEIDFIRFLSRMREGAGLPPAPAPQG